MPSAPAETGVLPGFLPAPALPLMMTVSKEHGTDTMICVSAPEFITQMG
jgi:hypothetical protein